MTPYNPKILMQSARKYKRLEKELDQIVSAEIDSRFRPEPYPLQKAETLIEEKNEAIVAAHQKGNLADILPALLSAYLQIQQGGRLYQEPENGPGSPEYARYYGRRERLETLFGAALMALPQREFAHLVGQKVGLFEEKQGKARHISELIAEAEAIAQVAPTLKSDSTQHEDATITYLERISPLGERLRRVEARAEELRADPYLSAGLQTLDRAIGAAQKAIDAQTRKAAGFIFNQASSLYQTFKSTPATALNLEKFTAQKGELARYSWVFAQIGDPRRKARVDGFISSIEAAIQNLQKGVDRQKRAELEQSEKQAKKLESAYQRFLDLKQRYSDGEFSEQSQEKNAFKDLKKIRGTLLAAGHRVRAREIDRFLNATGLGKPSDNETINKLEADLAFYKKAFAILVPTCIGLLFLLVMGLRG